MGGDRSFRRRSRPPRRGQKLVDDQDLIADADLFVKFDDLVIAHEHAARAEGLADPVFVVGAVDVDVALIGIDVPALIDARFEAPEPEDAAGDEVFVVGFSFQDLEVVSPGGHAGFKNHAGRLAGSDALGDFVEPARCALRILDIRRRAFGRGNHVALYQHTLREELEGGCADPHHEEPFSKLDAEAGAGFVDQLQRRITRENRIH